MHLPRRVIGGQCISAVSAFIAAQLFLGSIGFQPTLQPFSPVILRQVAATFLAVLVTTAGMNATNTEHPPAYATTLIISLGFLRTVGDLIVFLLAIFIVVLTHELVKWSTVWDLPYEYER